MRKLTGIAGLFFTASLAVYSGQANPLLAATAATVGERATKDNSTVVDPFAVSSPTPATPAAASDTASDAAGTPLAATPTTNPSVVPLSENTTGGAPSAGQSVTSSQVSMSDAGTVEIHVNDANLLEVLRMLSLQSQKNIVASKEVTGTITANLYNVTVREALDAILHTNGYAYREKGNFIYVYTTKELIDLEKQNRQLNTQLFRLYYIPVADAAAMIKPVLSAEGQTAMTKDAGKGITTSGGAGGSSSGGGTGDTGGNSYAGNDILVVTDYSENLDKVRGLIKEIDRRPRQVLIEATILQAELDDNNQLGVNLSFLGGVDFSSLLGSGNGVSGVLSPNVINTPSASSSSSSGGSGGTTGGTGTSTSAGPILNKGFAGFQSGGGGLQVGVVHKNLSVFINALESVTNTTILANPKVLALDKQAANVHVGSSLGYQTTTVTQTTSTQTVQFLDTGITLSFRPYISDDGFVRMEIHPEDSSGTLSTTGVPQKQTTDVTTNVMVKDGHTVVIGGLFRETSSTSRGQVPGLGSIPFLGALFRQQQDSTTRQEVIILLTPHIINDESAYSELSEAELKKADEYRVGVRRGMMFFGRERLAETAYQNAQRELNSASPNKNLAMWHLNVATNLNPTFLEAIELKEQISGRHVTSVDNSTMHNFVSRAILSDIGASPATQPAVSDITGRSPRRSSDNVLDEPTTQPAPVMPVVADGLPATQPATQPIADAPATQPVLQAADSTTQPNMQAASPATQPSLADSESAPGTQPDQSADVESADQVTELSPMNSSPATPPVAENLNDSSAPVVAVSTDTGAPGRSADEKGNALSSAARYLADAANKLASAADNLATYAGDQPQANKMSNPTTHPTQPAGTVTALPADDADAK